MNLLAHAYLSFQDPHLLTGNMISDFVKGKRQFDYPPAILRGIRLHRAIDQFTDQHPATRAAKEIFRSHYRLYAGACVDVSFDHFMANDSSHFQDENTLKTFAAGVYNQLSAQMQWLPTGFSVMLPHMEAQNWLYHYRFRFGIARAFGGLVHRAVHMHDSETAFRLFESSYELLQRCYHDFFPDLYRMAEDWIASDSPNEPSNI